MNLKQLARTIKTSAFTLAVAATLPALATDYYWIGGASGNWNDGANWSLNDGGAAAGVYPVSTDSASFSSSAEVSLQENAAASNLTIAAGVRVLFASNTTTARNLQLISYTCEASSQIALSNINLYPVQNLSKATKLVIGGIVEIVEGTDNCICAASWRNSGSDKPASALDLTGSLIGSGNLTVGSMGNSSRGYFSFAGDNSGFTGTITTHRNTDAVSWANEETGSSQAVWNLAQHDGKSLEIKSPAGTTNKFGRLLCNGVYLKNTNGAKLEIGALGGESTLNTASGTFDVIKVGSGNLTIDGNQTGNVVIQEGSVTIGSASAVLASISRAFTFAGGVLVNAYGTDISPYLANSGATDSAIVIDDIGVDAVWSTALPSSVSGGFTKRGSGTLRLSAVPAYTGTTTVEAGTLILPGNTSLDKLSVAEGASLIVVGLDGDTFTVSEFAEGTTTANVQAAAGSTLSWSGDTATISRSDAPFTWTDATGDHDWANHGNWSVGGVVATTAPLAVDTVLFPAAGAPWTVTLSSIQTVAAVQVNGATTFSGARIQVADGVETAAVTGDGTITLGDNAGFYPGSGENLKLTVSNNLEIVAAEAAPAKVQGRIKTSSSGGATIRIEGDLTGSGYVEFGGTRSSTYINGDNREFAGYVTIPDDAATAGARRLEVYFKDVNAVSSNAVWTIYNNNGAPVPSGPSLVYCFGALMGEFKNTLASSRSSSWFELGAANTDFALKFFGVDYGADRQDKIRKVGTGTMTLNDGTAHIREYEFADGLVCLVGDAAAPSVSAKFLGGELKLADTFTVDISDKIVSSTSPIVFDDGDTNRTWATALAESNIGGLTKKGEGTLTLSEKPLYTGLTTVEAGTLVVPEGTELSYNALSDAANISGATITNYAYAANTTLDAPATSGSVTYDAPLDIANVTAIDASGVTLTKGQPYVIASATAITGYDKASLAAIELTLPDGVDAAKWVVKVLDVDGKRALCVAPKISGMIIIVR